MKIISLEAENVKRLRSVHIEPKGATVVLGGRNGQGKSSTLDAIEMALGGTKSIPAEPVRHGARKARIVVNLGDLVVERTFSAKGTQLVVKSADGTPQKSPQGILDALCSKVAFDPLEFARMDAKKQDEVLKRVLGLDFSEFDAERARAYSERTQVQRDAKALQARVDAMPRHTGIGGEVSVSELLAELDRRGEASKERERLLRESERLESQVRHHDHQVIRLEEKLEELTLSLEVTRQHLANEKAARESVRCELGEAARAVSAHAPPDVSDIREQLASAEETNRKVRENHAHDEAVEELDALELRADALSSAIESIDERKRAALEAAEFPVSGLGFDELGPTLNGVPLAQASQAERLRVSVAIGLALNPALKVLLVRDGALLDDESMALLAQMAAEADAQVWIERVGKGDPGALVIEDGEVEGRPATAEAN